MRRCSLYNIGNLHLVYCESHNKGCLAITGCILECADCLSGGKCDGFSGYDKFDKETADCFGWYTIASVPTVAGAVGGCIRS